MDLIRSLLLLTLWSLLSTVLVAAQSLASQRQREDRRALYNPNLFEGDIQISSKEIKDYYEDIDSNEQSTSVRVHAMG